jgi:hypothetical protein
MNKSDVICLQLLTHIPLLNQNLQPVSRIANIRNNVSSSSYPLRHGTQFLRRPGTDLLLEFAADDLFWIISFVIAGEVGSMTVDNV